MQKGSSILNLKNEGSEEGKINLTTIYDKVVKLEERVRRLENVAQLTTSPIAPVFSIEESIRANLPFYTEVDFVKGQRRLIQFVIERILRKDGYLMYRCTDKKNKTFSYCGEFGKVVEDAKAEELSRKIKELFPARLIEIRKNLMKEGVASGNIAKNEQLIKIYVSFFAKDFSKALLGELLANV